MVITSTYTFKYQRLMRVCNIPLYYKGVQLSGAPTVPNFVMYLFSERNVLFSGGRPARSPKKILNVIQINHIIKGLFRKSIIPQARP